MDTYIEVLGLKMIYFLERETFLGKEFVTEIYNINI